MKFLDLLGLTEFLNKCKTIFASIIHTHKIEDLEDYVVDSELSTESSNPVENKVVQVAIQKLTDEKANNEDIPTKITDLENDSDFVTNDNLETALLDSIADWNQNDENAKDYIKNRTHYENFILTEIYPETTFDAKYLGTGNYYYGSVGDDFTYYTFSGYDEVVIVFDGEQYIESTTDGWIGNDYLVRGIDIVEGENQPFCIVHKLDDTTLDFISSSVYAKTQGIHTIAVYSKTSTIKTIDEKFIPDSVVKKDYLEQQLDSSIADWDQNDETDASYIKNRTHYVDESLTEVYPELSITCNNRLDFENYYYYTGYFPEEGFVDLSEVNVVIWNGVKYEVTPDSSAIGNDNIIKDNIEDNGLPFLIYNNYLVETDEYSNANVFTREEGTYTFTLCKKEETIKTLDEKYIPDTIARKTYVDDRLNNISWNDLKDKPFEEAESLVELYPSTTLNVSTETYDYFRISVDGLNSGVFENYNNIRIIFDGVSYDFYEIQGYYGNGYFYNTTYEDNGMPFCLERMLNLETFNWINAVLYARTQGNHTLAVYALDSSIKTLDEKFIPSTIAKDSDLQVVDDKLNDHENNADIHFSAIERTKLTSIEENANHYEHPTSGVNAGTYTSVTVDSYGHITSATNPTTLSGYGITDAEEKGTVNIHNSAADAHSDIRLLISELTTQVSNFLDVDDITKDQLSEVIGLIENNSDLIEGITTSKVNVSDIIDNLTTNVADKPLSAAQGVAIKSLIDALQSSLDSEIANRESADTQNLTTAKSYTDTSIANQTTETWTFTLTDGSTVTKKVVVK